MTDFASLLVADRGQDARTLHVVHPDSWSDWLAGQPPRVRAIAAANGLTGKAGNSAILPGDSADDWSALLVCDEPDNSPWRIASRAAALPAGCYRLAQGAPGEAALGWLLAQHRFDRFKSKPPSGDTGKRILLTGEPASIEPIVRLAEATALVRDLVNTPALELGPAELEKAVRDRLAGTNAQIRVTAGDDLSDGYPLIAAVGAAATAERSPRLIEATWGKPDHPRIAIVGKGVCFDSGGLDIKSGAGMRQMKKDMGGAAHALALAWLVIAARLPVRLHLLIPAVENAVSGAAIRPGDVVRSRSGLFVEIDNTDAEGRLILADSLARAAEDKPELIVDFATLTGAARVALGPDLPALFSTDDELAARIERSARDVYDPLWRLPLWDPYDDLLKSDVADVANSAGSPMAGAVVAAMFMKRFLPDGLAWAHLDTFAWRENPRPGRPRGGEALGLRAFFDVLEKRFADG